MSRPRPVTVTYGNRSASIAPFSPSVRAAVDRAGCPSQWDNRNKALLVPIQYADVVANQLSRAGLRVQVLFGLGVSA